MRNYGLCIALTLEAPPDRRVELFERLLLDIVSIISANPEMRPCKYNQYAGRDGSRILRGNRAVADSGYSRAVVARANL